MDHGFTQEQFDLLGKWQGHHYDDSDPDKVHAYSRLRDAYGATERWAVALQRRQFPQGSMEIRKAPINQGQAFSAYTWAKIYPARSSPKSLAFTVGIDTDGFIVKIDTVGNPPQRQAYEALRGSQSAGSPFAETLPPSEGLKMSSEQLVDWTAGAIGRFKMGYSEVAERIGLSVPKIELVTEDALSRDAFRRWREALLEAAVRRGPLHLLPEGAIVMRASRSGRVPDEDRVEIGIDPSGARWAVQINEPRIPGDHNSLSAIGVSADGELLLLRQGFLRPNEAGGITIKDEEFIGRTALAPVSVEAQGLAARRRWFRVCGLDIGPDEIRKETSAFVHRCAAARIGADAGEPAPKVEAADSFARGEIGGSYKRRARPAEEERSILRRHGSVWLALADLANAAGLRLRKGRHPLGYEVDAEIDGGTARPLLVEIKSAVSAGDVHAGVGQLHLYPRLMPRLRDYDRALLLPDLPAAEVQAAVQECGIAIYTFDLKEQDGDVAQVSFSPAFLKRCGAPDVS